MGAQMSTINKIKQRRNIGKIYSPADNLAEQAKQVSRPSKRKDETYADRA